MDVSEPGGNPATVAAQSVGQALQTARLARALTVEQVAMELRIEAPKLNALERNEFDTIGPPVFVKGYLRQYGQRLGLDYRDLLSMYYAQAERLEVIVQPSRTIKLRDERQITIWIIAAVLLVVLGVALVVWWVRSGGSLPLSIAPAAADDAAAVFIHSAALAAADRPIESAQRASSPGVPPVLDAPAEA
jgi:cytoskeleton protein RodZ